MVKSKRRNARSQKCKWIGILFQGSVDKFTTPRSIIHRTKQIRSSNSTVVPDKSTAAGKPHWLSTSPWEVAFKLELEHPNRQVGLATTQYSRRESPIHLQLLGTAPLANRLMICTILAHRIMRYKICLSTRETLSLMIYLKQGKDKRVRQLITLKVISMTHMEL